MNRRLFTAATISLFLAASGTVYAQATPVIPQLPAPTSSAVELTLPQEVISFADTNGIAVPDQFRPDETPAQTAELRGRLRAATEHHLADMGHHNDDRAAGIAQEWAGQAARGEVVFYGNSGNGNTHLNEGYGNIYRFSPAEAESHIQWLNRDANTVPDGRGYGVATSARRGTVYLVEFFVN